MACQMTMHTLTEQECLQLWSMQDTVIVQTFAAGPCALECAISVCTADTRSSEIFQSVTVKAMLAPDMCLPHGRFAAVAAIASCTAAAISPFNRR